MSSYRLVRAIAYEGVIVSEEAAGLGRFLYARGGWPIPYWTPTFADVTALEDRLPACLKQSPPPESPGLADKLSSYQRQYSGVVLGGRKVVHINFIAAHSLEALAQSFLADWSMLIDDGGDGFFQVDYDVEFQSFSNLRVNGEA
jgi:hypothetical protein